MLDKYQDDFTGWQSIWGATNDLSDNHGELGSNDDDSFRILI
jgi:hypothetical protein